MDRTSAAFVHLGTETRSRSESSAFLDAFRVILTFVADPLQPTFFFSLELTMSIFALRAKSLKTALARKRKFSRT